MFQVDIDDLNSNKFEFMSQLQQQTTTVDSWIYWELELFIKKLNDKNKKEKEEREKQEKEQQGKYGDMSRFNPSSMMNQYKGLNKFGGNTSAYPRI